MFRVWHALFFQEQDFQRDHWKTDSRHVANFVIISDATSPVGAASDHTVGIMTTLWFQWLATRISSWDLTLLAQKQFALILSQYSSSPTLRRSHQQACLQKIFGFWQALVLSCHSRPLALLTFSFGGLFLHVLSSSVVFPVLLEVCSPCNRHQNFILQTLTHCGLATQLHTVQVWLHRTQSTSGDVTVCRLFGVKPMLENTLT